jgi:ligand-binding SRPBCC domain-containing protein
VPQVVRESVLPCSVQDLWDFHRSVEALLLLTPPSSQVTVVGATTAVEDGALHELRIRKGGISFRWNARISQVNPPNGFVDTAERSPFQTWRHHHQFLPHADGAVLRDTVDYSLPFGFLGTIADRLFVRRDIERMFEFRHAATLRAVTQQKAPTA